MPVPPIPQRSILAEDTRQQPTRVFMTLDWLKWLRAFVDHVTRVILPNQALRFVALADADAENDTVYYSTDGLSLAHKDSSGVVHYLY